jgi:hypothetical protein
MATNQFSFLRIEHDLSPGGQVIETYCPACGALVAASPKAKLLDLVEEIHICLESMAFAHSSQERDIREQLLN